MKWLKASLILGAFFLVSGHSIVEAASLYIDPAMNTLYRGDAVKLAVRLDIDEAKNECVNAVDAVIHYSENIEPVDISVGSSILNVWVEPPVINSAQRTITFAGGIPNGYCGRVSGDPRLTNILTEIVFRSPGFVIGSGDGDESVAEVYFSNETTAYLNDGQGTKAQLVTYGARFDLEKTAGPELKKPWREQVGQDVIPPEEFSISLQKDTKAFSGKYFIVWNTTDKQTGIDQYFVMEEPVTQLGAFKWGRADAPWIEARSPYVLGDQTLNSVVRVRAIDKAGNEYIATLLPDESMRSITQAQIITYVVIGFMIITFVLLLVIFSRIVMQRKNRRKESNKDSIEEELLDNNEDEYDE